MSSSGKSWTRAITPSTPLADAAAVVLVRRLDAAASLVDKAARSEPGTPRSVKQVHALRVATRRAAAALDVFEHAVPEKAAAKLRKRLRTIRRAAGEARDLDVQAELVADAARGAAGVSKDSLRALLRRTRALRKKAQAPLRKVARKWPSRTLRHDWRELAGGAHVKGDEVFGVAARRTVGKAIARLEVAAGKDLRVVENVHNLRRKLKRLRYAMEEVSVCFGEPWKKTLQPRLVVAQKAIGEINDAHVLLLRLVGESGSDAPKGRAPATTPRGIGPLVRRQRDLLARSHAAFLGQWQVLRDGGFFAEMRRELGLETGNSGADRPGGLEPEPGVPTVPTRILRPIGLIEPKSHLPERSSTARLNGSRPKGSSSERSGRLPGGRRRIAAIDVGTNSIRLIVAEAQPDGSYRILDDEKEITRLGKGLSQTGKLAPETIEHSVVAIDRMKSIAEGYGATEIQVVGTSAAREAKNGAALGKQVRERTGLDLQVISGEEEAMLAYRSAANAFDLAGVSGAVVDIGGGSTEIVLSAAVGPGSESRRAGLGGGVIERVYTIPIGAVRLTDRFGGPERCSGKRFEEMREFIKQTLADHVGHPPMMPQLVVGTGGTLTTLAAMVIQKELGAGGDGLFSGGVQGLEVGRADLRHLLEYLRKLPVKERPRVPGLSADRADIIVAGLAIVDCVLKRFGANRVRVHEGGIRDGILLSMVGRGAETAGSTGNGTGGGARRDPMKGVRRFARSCAYEAAHAKHVTTLALEMFDQFAAQRDQLTLKPGMGFDPEHRTLLEAAALLHDIGYLINYARHHKHSYHLIVHADLPGLTTRQVQVVANVARYHRSAEPKLRHRPFALLSEQDRALVRGLSGILRMADGLDRTHMQSVRGVKVRVARAGAHFEVNSEHEPAVDVWGAVRKSGLFKEVFGLLPHFAWKSDAIRADPARGRDRERVMSAV